MSQILASTPPAAQAHARDLVDIYAARRIATVLAQRVSGDFHATLDGCSPEDRVRFMADALGLLRQRHGDAHQRAVYFAAECMTPSGIGSKSHEVRSLIVSCVEVALRAYRQALAGQAAPATLELLGQLAEADAMTDLAKAPGAARVM